MIETQSRSQRQLTGNGRLRIPSSQGSLTFLQVLLPLLCNFLSLLLKCHCLNSLFLILFPNPAPPLPAGQGFSLFLPVTVSDFWKCLTGAPLPPHPMLVMLGSSGGGGGHADSGTTAALRGLCVTPPKRVLSPSLRNHSGSFLISEKPLLTTEKGEHYVCV